MLEVEEKDRLAVVKETAEIRLFARKMENGCCVGPSAGEMECAKLITLPYLLVSAILSAGSIRKCQVEAAAAAAAGVEAVRLLYKYFVMA